MLVSAVTEEPSTMLYSMYEGAEPSCAALCNTTLPYASIETYCAS